MSLSAIKEKMQRIKDSIDDAEERESDAKAQLKEAESREEVQLNEAESMRRRMKLLTVELNKTDDRLAEVEEKLDLELNKTQTHEEARRGLEDWEIEGDEKLQDLEFKVKETERTDKESSDKLVEAQRRYVVLTRDLERALSKGDALESRVEELSEKLDGGVKRVKSLEENEEQTYDREEETEEKIKFLDEQVKQFEQRADIAERECNKLERITDQVQTEIVMWDKKRKDLEDEMRESLAELDFEDD